MAARPIMDEVLPVSVTVLLPTRNEEEALGATGMQSQEVGVKRLKS